MIKSLIHFAKLNIYGLLSFPTFTFYRLLNVNLYVSRFFFLLI